MSVGETVSRRAVVIVTAKGRTKPRYRSAVVRGVKTLSESDRRARRRRLSTQNVVFSNAVTRKTLYGSESGWAVVVVVAVAILNPREGFWVEIPFVGFDPNSEPPRAEGSGFRGANTGARGSVLVAVSGEREADTPRFPFVGRLFMVPSGPKIAL